MTYEPGDLVVDADQPADERGTMVVLRVPGVSAKHYDIQSLGKTVAEVNTEYDDHAGVAECAYVGWLDSHVPEWRQLLADSRTDWGDCEDATFYDGLVAFSTEWKIPKQVYAYPLGRLRPRRYCPDHLMRATYVPPYRPAGEPALWVCPLPDCGNDAIGAPVEPLNAFNEKPRPDDEWDMPVIHS